MDGTFKIDEFEMLLAQIHNEKLKEDVLEIYQEMLSESSFEHVNDVPMIHADPTKKNTFLIHHEAVCTEAAWRLAKCVQEAYGVRLNMDFLIAGDLLHDASKFLEYWKKDEEVGKTKLGKLLTHSIYAAHKAYEKGMPKEIVHMIMAHTPIYSVPAANIEAFLAYYTDVLVGELRRNKVGVPVKGKKTVR